jgi:hypothetical protein
MSLSTKYSGILEVKHTELSQWIPLELLMHPNNRKSETHMTELDQEISSVETTPQLN